jgi:hypothetical protein
MELLNFHFVIKGFTGIRKKGIMIPWELNLIIFVSDSVVVSGERKRILILFENRRHFPKVLNYWLKIF